MSEPQPSPDYPLRTFTAVFTAVASILTLVGSCIPSSSAPPANIYVTDSAGVVVDAPQIAALAGSQPGSYLITTWETGKKVESLSVVIGDGVGPGPQPKPEPKPEPKPQPKPSELWCVIVEESHDRTPAQAAVILSTKFRAIFADKRFRVVDKDKGDADCAAYIQRAVGAKLPQIYIVSPAGDIVHEGPLPTSEADAVALATRIKEGK